MGFLRDRRWAVYQPNGSGSRPVRQYLWTDAFNNRIQEFSSNGTFKTKWGSLGGTNGQFEVPVDVAVDRSGLAYVVDFLDCSVQKFDLQWQAIYLPLLLR
jgi:DNA-binding beta-propeller fold protein YncE